MNRPFRFSAAPAPRDSARLTDDPATASDRWHDADPEIPTSAVPDDELAAALESALFDEPEAAEPATNAPAPERFPFSARGRDWAEQPARFEPERPIDLYEEPDEDPSLNGEAAEASEEHAAQARPAYRAQDTTQFYDQLTAQLDSLNDDRVSTAIPDGFYRRPAAPGSYGSRDYWRDEKPGLAAHFARWRSIAPVRRMAVTAAGTVILAAVGAVGLLSVLDSDQTPATVAEEPAADEAPAVVASVVPRAGGEPAVTVGRDEEPTVEYTQSELRTIPLSGGEKVEEAAAQAQPVEQPDSGSESAMTSVPVRTQTVRPAADDRQAPSGEDSGQSTASAEAGTPRESELETASVASAPDVPVPAPAPEADAFESEGVTTTGSIPADTAEPVASPTRTAPVTSAVNMRAGPENGAETLTIVPSGASVGVVGCDQWCEVVYEGQQGWIYKSFVSGADQFAAAGQ